MKMGKLEKLFVNSAGHSKSVSRRGEQIFSHAETAPGKRLLDVGSGNGAVVINMARKHKLDVTGVDVDPEQIQLAQLASYGMANVKFMLLDGQELPFDDGSFDIVSAFRVIHHIANWRDALADILRVVKPGGYFVYSDLTFPTWLAAIGARTVKDVGYPTLDGLAKVVEENDLSLVYASKTLILYDVVYRKDEAWHGAPNREQYSLSQSRH